MGTAASKAAAADDAATAKDKIVEVTMMRMTPLMMMLVMFEMMNAA